MTLKIAAAVIFWIIGVWFLAFLKESRYGKFKKKSKDQYFKDEEEKRDNYFK